MRSRGRVALRTPEARMRRFISADPLLTGPRCDHVHLRARQPSGRRAQLGDLPVRPRSSKGSASSRSRSCASDSSCRAAPGFSVSEDERVRRRSGFCAVGAELAKARDPDISADDHPSRLRQVRITIRRGVMSIARFGGEQRHSAQIRLPRREPALVIIRIRDPRRQ